jgi:Kdo2-lipid IVA lauroyltransferase/acyltransferase
MEKGWAYYAGKIFSKLVCLLPYNILLWIGTKLGRLYYLLAKSLRERAKRQMMRGLAISETEAEPILKRVFCKVLLNGLEFFYLPNISKENIHEFVDIEGLTYLDEALKQGKGVILLTAHYGNWELFGIALTMLGYPMVGIGKPQPQAGITLLLTEYRTRFGGEFYYKGVAIRHVMRALKENKILYMVSDQDGGRGGVFIDFLNKPASTPPGPAAFARKFNAPVVPAFIRRENGKHVITIEPPLALQETANSEADVQANLVTMTKRVEEQIKKYPDEWLWFQKRWNTPVEVVTTDE